jgi:hypothetical protein
VGNEIRPSVARFIEGSYDEFLSSETAQRDKQKRENRSIAALGKLQERDQVWRDFSQTQALYTEAVSLAMQQGQDPMAALAGQGIQPPEVLSMLRDAGVNVPTVEDYDDHAAHLRALDLWRLSDGYDAVHPLVKQAAREHAEQHKKMLSGTLAQMGMQTPPDQGQGPSQPAPKGQPSPPKDKGMPNASTMGTM